MNSWGRYQVERLLSEGAMGRVLLAWDPLLERHLVVKAMKPLPEDRKHKEQELRERFLREAKILSRLKHKNLVTVYDFGIEAGNPFIAMEYVPGSTLDHYMERHSDLSQMNPIILQILAGLEYAHAQGVIHRDLKPANILITEEKEVKITDFGIARTLESELTQEGQLLGSPNYMAPEQIRGEESTPATDLYALGVILYRWLTGKRPFEAESLPELFEKILNSNPLPLKVLRPDLPSALEEFLGIALAKSPQHRFLSAQEFRCAWEKAIGGFLAPPEAGPNPTLILEAFPPLQRSLKGIPTAEKPKPTRVEEIFYEISQRKRRSTRPSQGSLLTKGALLFWFAMATLLILGGVLLSIFL